MKKRMKPQVFLVRILNRARAWLRNFLKPRTPHPRGKEKAMYNRKHPLPTLGSNRASQIPIWLAFKALLITSLLALVAACGGGGDGGNLTAAPQGVPTPPVAVAPSPAPAPVIPPPAGLPAPVPPPTDPAPSPAPGPVTPPAPVPVPPPATGNPLPELVVSTAGGCITPDRGSSCTVEVEIGFKQPAPAPAAWNLYQDGRFVQSGTSLEGSRSETITLSGEPKAHSLEIRVADWNNQTLFTRPLVLENTCPADAPWYQPPLAGATGMCWQQTCAMGGEAHVASHVTQESVRIGGWGVPHRLVLDRIVNPDQSVTLRPGGSVPVTDYTGFADYSKSTVRIMRFGLEDVRNSDGERPLPGFFSVIVWLVSGADRVVTYERMWVDAGMTGLFNFGLRTAVTDEVRDSAWWFTDYDPTWGGETRLRSGRSTYLGGIFYTPGQSFDTSFETRDVHMYSIWFKPDAVPWPSPLQGTPPGVLVYDGFNQFPGSVRGQVLFTEVVNGLTACSGTTR